MNWPYVRRSEYEAVSAAHFALLEEHRLLQVRVVDLESEAAKRESPTVEPESLPEPITTAMIARAQPGTAAWRRLRKYARDAARSGQSPSLIADTILNGVA